VISRRAFIGAVAGGLAVAPAAASAQPAKKVARIGYLTGGSVELEKGWIASFRQGLRELGWVEGENVVLELRGSAGRVDRLSGLVEGLIRSKVDVLVTGGDAATLAAKNVTSSVPVVMVPVADPVGIGLVPSLGRPGGNITGLADLHADLVAKRLEILKDLVPSALQVAVLLNPANPAHALQLKALQAAAPAVSVTVLPREVSEPTGIDRAFAALKRERPAGLIVLGDRMFGANRKQIVELTIANRLPTVYTHKWWVESGGLASYGANFDDLYRRVATYVDKILKGTKPGDLPVEQPTRLELVINLKAAGSIGLRVPPSLLVRADQVIQ
jgi:putative tryptophan/tyrosine transport system substrate-binding protein